MKIFITGYSGFVGSVITKNLSKKYLIEKVNLRNLPDIESNLFNQFLDKFLDADVIINCAASLKPKTKKDIFLNEKFPIILVNHLKNIKKKIFFIHISSINILVDERKDFYTLTKRNAEKFLEKENVTIIRLPLIYEKNKNIIQPTGSFKQVDDYLKFKFLPIYPMIFPGHIHYPAEVNKVSDFVEKIILNENRKPTIYNIAGDKKKTLWNLFEEMANQRNKKTLKINFNIFNRIAPKILKGYLSKNSSVLQQLIIIDHTLYKEKKEYL
jgi:nucleoside-diphosphate-sugar epimerase